MLKKHERRAENFISLFLPYLTAFPRSGLLFLRVSKKAEVRRYEKPNKRQETKDLKVQRSQKSIQNIESSTKKSETIDHSVFTTDDLRLTFHKKAVVQ